LSDLPLDTPSRMGSKMLNEHFAPGVLGPVTVFIENKNVDFTDPKMVPAIEALTAAIEKNSKDLGLVDVRTLTQPLGNSEEAKKKIARARGDKDLEAEIRQEAQPRYISQQE